MTPRRSPLFAGLQSTMPWAAGPFFPNTLSTRPSVAPRLFALSHPRTHVTPRSVAPNGEVALPIPCPFFPYFLGISRPGPRSRLLLRLFPFLGTAASPPTRQPCPPCNVVSFMHRPPFLRMKVSPDPLTGSTRFFPRPCPKIPMGSSSVFLMPIPTRVPLPDLSYPRFVAQPPPFSGPRRSEHPSTRPGPLTLTRVRRRFARFSCQRPRMSSPHFSPP